MLKDIVKNKRLITRIGKEQSVIRERNRLKNKIISPRSQMKH